MVDSGTTIASGECARGQNGDSDTQCKADMKTWLETTGMPTVSNYHENSQPPASAPILSTVSDHCYGLHNASWTSVPDADNYQLFRSTQASFAGAIKMYDGTNTQVSVNVSPAAIWYLRVKACNSGGCSGYSNQRAADYINTCL